MLLAFTGSVSMDAMLTSATGVALPNMMGTFSVSLDEISWVSTFYLVAATIFLPLSVWFSTLFGSRNFFLGSVALFMISSLGCAVAPTLALLVFFRALQGAAASPFRARSLMALTTEMPVSHVIEALVFLCGGLSVASAIGVGLGGWLSELYTWRLIFLLPVPIGILSLGCLLFGLESKGEERPLAHVDWTSFLCLLAGLGSLQGVLSRGQREDWFHTPLITLLSGVAAVCLTVFVYRQIFHGRDGRLLNLGLLRERNMGTGMVLALFLGLFLNGGLFLLPQFLRAVEGRDGIAIGQLLTADALGLWLSTSLGTLWLKAAGAPRLLGLGSGIFALSMGIFAFSITSHIPNEMLLLPVFLRGLSLGFLIIPLGALATSNVAREDVGDARALYYFFRQIGGSVGVALIALAVDWRESFHSTHLAAAAHSPFLSGSLARMQQGLVARGVGPTSAPLAATAAFKQMFSREVQTLAYQDVFFALCIAGLLSAAFTFLFHGPHRRSATVQNPE